MVEEKEIMPGSPALIGSHAQLQAFFWKIEDRRNYFV